MACFEHTLSYDCRKQNSVLYFCHLIDILLKQVVVPQAHVFEVAALPSIVLQAAYLEQTLIEETQNRPVDASLQVVVPQVQSFSFTDNPLLLEHGGGAVQRFSEA